MPKKSKVQKSGVVRKIIKSPDPHEPEKAEISIHEADELYREVRIENTLETEEGEKVKLKQGAHVDVTVEADKNDTIPKKE